MHRLTLSTLGLLATTTLLTSVSAGGAIAASLTVNGTDAIFLAGRDDVTIPALDSSDPSFPLLRHGYVNADFLPETFPQWLTAIAGQTFAFAVTGGVDYYNAPSASFFGPDGNGTSGSNLNSLGGISGFLGPQGPLVGLFLNDDNPQAGPAPTRLDFTPGGLGTNFGSLAPELGQVFFIGDGLTGDGLRQKFIAPTGATRLFLGVADGFGFGGAPGAYDDNNGAFAVETVPEPGAIAGLLALSGLLVSQRRRSSATEG